jgi:hypothetical protein
MMSGNRVREWSQSEGNTMLTKNLEEEIVFRWSCVIGICMSFLQMTHRRTRVQRTGLRDEEAKKQPSRISTKNLEDPI